MKLLAVALLAPLVSLAATASRVTFVKVFKGSNPPYYEISVSDDGSAVYKESPTDEQPVHYQLEKKDTETLFAIVTQIDRCGRPLESGLKVANLGMKTVRCEDVSGKREVSFNYSTDPGGQAIADFFERLRETQQALFNLETAVRFDKLGVNKALLQIETLWDRNQLIGPERFIPMLERVMKNDTFMNMARERAEKLIIAFHNGKEPPASEARAEGSSKR
jgi:hypothetical protein